MSLHRETYNGAGVAVAYLLSLAGIFSGLVFPTNITVCVFLVVFLLWDIGFVFLEPTAFEGRTVESTNESVTRARTYVSWFLPLYGAIIAVYFSQSAEVQKRVTSMLNEASIPRFLILTPFVLAAASILFFPITLKDRSNTQSSEISSALKWIFLINVYCQKAIIFIFAHLALRVVAAIPR